MKKILLVLFILLFTFNVNAAVFDRDIKLKSCIDGDTATFIIEEEDVKIRFLSINAPEKDSEKYGKEASNYACKLLTDAKEIIIEYDDKTLTDKYDRILAWIWVDDYLLQERLVSEGYAEVAYVYDKYKYSDSLCLKQYNAIKYKKNIWSTDREEDYCGSVDLTKVTDIISIQQLTIDEENGTVNDEDLQKIVDQFKTTQNIANAFEKATDSVNEYLNNNGKQFSNVLLYVLLAIAGLYVLKNTIDGMKK